MTPHLARRAVRVTSLLILAQGVALFASAGSLAYWNAWLYLALQALTMGATNTFLYYRDPQLLDRRLASEEAGERDPVQRWVLRVMRIAALAMLTRTVGFTAIAGIGIALLVNRRWREAKVFAAVSSLVVVPWLVWSKLAVPGGGSVNNYLTWVANHFDWRQPFANLWNVFSQDVPFIFFAPLGSPDIQAFLTRSHLALALPRLSASQIAGVVPRFDTEVFPPGAVIIRQGDPARRFYIVLRGAVDVVNHHPAGDIVIGSLGPGEYFGEIGLLQGRPRMATVRAAADSEAEVMALDEASFRALMTESQQTSEEIARQMAERLVELGQASA